MPDGLGLQAGSLDGPSQYKPAMDVFTSSAQPWICVRYLTRPSLGWGNGVGLQTADKPEREFVMTSKTVTCALAVLIAAASIGFAMTDSFARTRGAADPADLVN